MLGQRYGYRALPPEIESVEFETLSDIIKKEKIAGSHLLEVWYKLDTNSIPPVYVLQVCLLLRYFIILKQLDYCI